MNFTTPLNSFHTPKIKQTDLHFLQSRTFGTSKETMQYLQSISHPKLPFLIHLQLVKTIKSVIPTVKFQYITPNKRRLGTIKYESKLQRNATTLVSLKQLYAKVLKI